VQETDKVHPEMDGDTVRSANITNEIAELYRNDIAINLSLCNKYDGMGANTLANNLGVSEEEATKFLTMYFASFPGLEESFAETKKLAVKRGWIQICKQTDKRYFFRNFKRMNDAKEVALSFYPEDYRFYSPEKRAEFKKELYESNPEVKEYWREFAIEKGILERRSVNFRIQGSSATQTKMALLYFLQNWTEDCFPVLSVHD